tara:strand:- start:22065 stop:22229 length:165 start_codon:yes stop_codon:yes gene_type:complete
MILITGAGRFIGKYQNFTEGDMTKIKKAGFTNFTSLEDGIKYCVDNFISERRIV